MEAFGLDTDEAKAMIKDLGRVLHGHHPAAQGGALAHITAIWIAAHPAKVHELLFALQVATTGEILKVLMKEKANGNQDENKEGDA